MLITGTKLGIIAKDRELTAYRIARDTGIPENTVRYWINDPKRSINNESQILLANYLGVTVDHLVGNDEKTPAIHDPDDERNKIVLKKLKGLTDEQLEKVRDYIDFVSQTKKKKGK